MSEEKEVCRDVVVEKVDEPKTPLNMSDFLESVPEGFKGEIIDAMKEREAQRNGLIEEIESYGDSCFCSSFLSKSDTKVLKSIANLVGKATRAQEQVEESKPRIDYSLKGGDEMSEEGRSSAPVLSFS